MAASEGVRRLSLVLGLVVAVPWFSITLGLFVSDTTWGSSYRTNWDNWVVERDRTTALVDSLVGMRSVNELHSTEKLLIADLLKAAFDKQPPTPRVAWEYFVATLLSPVVYLVAWGTVRVIPWVIEGFRQETNPTSGVGDEDS